MKKIGLLAVGTAAMVMIGCTSAPPSIDTGPDAEVTFDGLYEVKNSRADKAWALPGLDLKGYTKIMLQGAGVEYRPGGESGRTSFSRNRGGPFEVTEQQKVRFEDTVRQAFLDELSQSESLEIVSEPGPDVLLVRGALLDVVSYVPPDDLPGRVDVYLSSVGEATLVIEVRDSITGAILARAIDRQAAEGMSGMLTQSNRVTNTAEVRRVVRRWASALRQGLERITTEGF